MPKLPSDSRKICVEGRRRSRPPDGKKAFSWRVICQVEHGTLLPQGYGPVFRGGHDKIIPFGRPGVGALEEPFERARVGGRPEGV